MSTNSYYDNLSKDELISLLLNKEKELSKLEEKSAEAETRAAAAEEKAAAAEEKANAAEERAIAAEKKIVAAEKENTSLRERKDTAEGRLKNIYILLKDRGDLMKETFHELKKIFIIFDKITFDNMEIQLGKLFDEYAQWILNACQFRDLTYGTGNDLRTSSNGNKNENNTSDNKEDDKKDDDKKENNETKKIKEQENNILSSSIKDVSKIENFLNKLENAINKTSVDEISSCSKEIHHISETKREKGKAKENKPSPGRQRVDRTIAATILPEVTEDDKVCSVCGSKKIESAGTISHKLIGLRPKLDELIEFYDTHSELQYCHECGHVHAVFGEDADLPVQPDRELSVNLMLHCMDAVCNGVPLNRIAKYMHEVYHVGHSTLQKTFHMFVTVYLVPLRDYFYERAKKAQYLMLDGTPFPSLENKSLGNCMNKNPDRKRNSNEPDAVPVEAGSSNYLLCCCNVPGAKEPFITYYFLPTRSYAAIAKVITSDFRCTTLVTDAFQAYDKLADDRECSLQNCIIHFRRHIIRACDPEQLAKELVTKEEQLQSDFLMGMLREGNSRILLCCVFLALTKIYSYESSYDRSQPDCLEKILKIRQTIVRPLMDDIDKIMKHLIDNLTDPAEQGEGRRERRGDPYSKAAVYWHNNHTKLRTFLDDALIPPDTNKVEQSIRPVTLIRKNSYFMTSQDGMYDLCTILTVNESLKCNGIAYPAAAIADYCRAFASHCYDAGYTKMMRENGLTYAKKITSWNMPDLSEGFDFDEQFSKILNK